MGSHRRPQPFTALLFSTLAPPASLPSILRSSKKEKLLCVLSVSKFQLHLYDLRLPWKSILKLALRQRGLD